MSARSLDAAESPEGSFRSQAHEKRKPRVSAKGLLTGDGVVMTSFIALAFVSGMVFLRTTHMHSHSVHLFRLVWC